MINRGKNLANLVILLSWCLINFGRWTQMDSQIRQMVALSFFVCLLLQHFWQKLNVRQKSRQPVQRLWVYKWEAWMKGTAWDCLHNTLAFYSWITFTKFPFHNKCKDYIQKSSIKYRSLYQKRIKSHDKAK